MIAAEGDSFPELLRRRRRRAGLSQVQLAELSGLGVRTIRNGEQGWTLHPHLDSVRRLAEGLGLTGEARATFERIAAGTYPLRLAAAPELPRQLPHDLADFTGRLEETARVRVCLCPEDGTWRAASYCAQRAPMDARRLHPCEDSVRATVAQVRELLRRLGASRPVPLFVFDAGYDPNALSHELRADRAAVLLRIKGDRVFYIDPAQRKAGTIGRPRRHGKLEQEGVGRPDQAAAGPARRRRLPYALGTTP